MKNATMKPATKPVQVKGKTRPENKDDMDSRKNEEQDFKGSDITHNKKETKAEKMGDNQGS
ncbi:hypothetical protein HNQ91_000499 [Filimonas zeae]|uniref:Uncharacterized protein n=1 Tax=Filimonas zeae TaxID=1737353 RepID=A0A917IN64_9BACT|nr:hypothetical protein [Filimonas zeae]MDR6337477.1 hypothetical protein [Filimonas zeae]GGH58814.1 hypothetical protein GCM10011379_04900 [Filimonas zeae]